MHEIITIQIGQQANYLATHFWNTQESYQTFPPAPPSPVNHDIHFRQGLARDGSETYLARTLIYDFKSGFGSLARINALDALEEHPGEAELWNGPLSRLTPAPQIQPSPYVASLLASTEPVAPTPSTTAYFADFASTYYHPRSLYPLIQPYPTIAQTSPSASSFTPSPQFSSFEHGASLFASRDVDIDVLDTDLRPWAEEADAPQAIQIFASTSDAWGGFAARYLERLRDEFPKTCLWVWGVDAAVPGQSKARLREQGTNAALALHDIGGNASMFVPLGVPGFLPGNARVDRSVLWHTSGLLNAGVESAGLAGRMVGEGRVPVMGDWENALSGNGRRRIAGLKFGVGEQTGKKEQKSDQRMRGGQAGMGEDEDGEEVDKELDEGLDINLLPQQNVGSGTRGRVLGRKNKVFSRIDTFRADELTDTPPRTRRKGGPIVECYDPRLPFPVQPTFPPIFRHPQDAKSVPIHTSLSASSSIATWVRSVQQSASAGMGLPSYLDGEEREALSNGLADVAEAYIEGWESGSDSDDN